MTYKYDAEITKYIHEQFDVQQSDLLIARDVFKRFKTNQNLEAVRSKVKYERAKLKKESEESGIVFECERSNMNIEDVKHGWIKTDTASLFFKNPNFKEGSISFEQLEQSFQKIIENLDPIQRKLEPVSEFVAKALKLTLTDSHVGMNPNPNNDALFQYEYNAEIYQNSMNNVFQSVVKEFNVHGAFEVIYIDDLGDMTDGWNGYTTRGGHELEQNLSNSEVFEICVDEKVRLIQRIAESRMTKKVVLRCVCNDNHSGDFALIINKAIKKIINILYDSDFVDVDILTRFIEHRTFGNHTFILTHGKDKKQMKGGLPIVLNDKTINFINEYIEHYEIDSKFIHVEKGDLHQISYQKTKKFDYRNFMSFAPPSVWVQHNFGDSYSGYSIQVIPKETNEISHTDYFLNYSRIK